jgi:hypothetical protein
MMHQTYRSGTARKFEDSDGFRPQAGQCAAQRVRNDEGATNQSTSVINGPTPHRPVIVRPMQPVALLHPPARRRLADYPGDTLRVAARQGRSRTAPELLLPRTRTRTVSPTDLLWVTPQLPTSSLREIGDRSFPGLSGMTPDLSAAGQCRLCGVDRLG